jgi:hypothetical protein
MGRKRQKRLEWLPKYVAPTKDGWLVYRPYLGITKGKKKYGREIRVCPDAKDHQYNARFKADFFRLFSQIQDKGEKDIAWLLAKYLGSRHVKENLTKKTIDNYERYADTIASQRLKHQSLGNMRLGDVALNKVKRSLIRKYLDNYPAPIQANRHVQFMKAAWTWVMQRYDNIENNPCIGVTLNPQKPRDRYIEDWEYAVVYTCATGQGVPIFAPAMEIAYLQRARRGEVFALRSTDYFDEGLFLDRSKGSDNEITEWSPRLRAAVAYCDAIYPDARTVPIDGRYLLHTKEGTPYKESALNSAWKRLINRAMRYGAKIPKELIEDARKAGAKIDGETVTLKDRFTFHDIKAKGKTDHPTGYAGHRSPKMEAVYQRKPKVIPATR